MDNIVEMVVSISGTKKILSLLNEDSGRNFIYLLEDLEKETRSELNNLSFEKEVVMLSDVGRLGEKYLPFSSPEFSLVKDIYLAVLASELPDWGIVLSGAFSGLVEKRKFWLVMKNESRKYEHVKTESHEIPQELLLDALVAAGKYYSSNFETEKVSKEFLKWFEDNFDMIYYGYSIYLSISNVYVEDKEEGL